MNIKRGQIHLAVLDPVVGKEISKTRPVLIVSNDKNNEFSGTATILPITSKNLQKIYKINLIYYTRIDKLRKLMEILQYVKNLCQDFFCVTD